MSRRVLFGLGIAGLLVLAACTPEGGGDVERQLEAVSALSEAVEGLEGSITETSSQLEGLEDRLGAVDERIEAFQASAETHALDRTAGIPEPPDGQVAFRLSFRYLPDSLPGEGIRSYEPLPEVSSVWAMESLPEGEELPVGDPIGERTIFLQPGEARTVTLAYENPSDGDVGFLVVPHQESPGHLSHFVWPQCLCMSFVYEVPAQGAWYRVIEITASPDTPPGSKVDVLWTVLTDPSVFPEE